MFCQSSKPKMHLKEFHFVKMLCPSDLVCLIYFQFCILFSRSHPDNNRVAFVRVEVQDQKVTSSNVARNDPIVHLSKTGSVLEAALDKNVF